jgi:hypothetical protein
MPTGQDFPDRPDVAPDTAVDAPHPDPAPIRNDAPARASRPHDEAATRQREGLAPDTMILVPAFAAPPSARMGCGRCSCRRWTSPAMPTPTT